ncbi:MAG: hypothetical protein FWG84_07330 [Bacteroidales bacterium]|nr:hypothetical protein [Bacteroidales bacterium]
MNKRLLLFLFVLGFNALYSQDLIVTSNQNSINCQILMIGDGLMHYSTMKNDETIKSSIPLEDVVLSVQGYYSPPTSSYTPPRKKSDYAHFRIAAAGGYSYRTASLPSGIPSDVRDYYRKSKNGFNYGVEFNYFFNQFLGMGINYYASRFNPAGDSPMWYPDKVSERVRIQQIIPTFNMRVFDRQKQGAFLASIGLGYVDYKDKALATDLNNLHFATMKGWSIGMLWSVGYDLPISQTLAIYFQASLTGGVVTKFTLIDEITGDTETFSVDDVNDGEGIGKINLSIGLRFAK